MLPWPRPRQPFMGVALAAVAGIVAADWWEVNPLGAVACVLAFAPVAILLRRWDAAAFIFAGVAFFSLHTSLHHGATGRHLADQFHDGPQVVIATGIVWSEPQVEEGRSQKPSARFHLRLEELTAGTATWPLHVTMPAQWAGPPPTYGDRVRVLGTAENIGPGRNPGPFDYPAWQRRHGMHTGISSREPLDCTVLAPAAAPALLMLAHRSRAWLVMQLQRGLEDSPDVSNLIASMLLGLRGETPEETKNLFRYTGTLHLFAVSGLNVAMLVTIAWWLLRPFGLRNGLVVLIIVPLLVGYAIVTGLTASCLRATVMATVLLLGYLVERRAVPFNAFFGAAVLILAFDTDQLFSAGFQLSFALVGVLLACGDPVRRGIERWYEPDPFLPRLLYPWRLRAGRWAWGQCAAFSSVTIVAWLGSLPFSVGMFHMFTPGALLANLLAVPLAFVILALGVASVLTGGWAPGLAVLFNNANWACAKALLWVVQLFAGMPFSYEHLDSATLAQSTPACEFTVFDFGPGSATHLRAGGQDWLVDAGPTWGYEHTVLPYLRHRGVDRLAGVLFTHGDAQHLGGALAALADLHPAIVVDSPLRDRSSTRRKLHSTLGGDGKPKRLLWRGDQLVLEGDRAMLRVLYPPLGLARSVADDKALVFRLEAGEFRALFVSDSGFAAEQWLVENEPDLQADILVKGWHGKDVSGTAGFIKRVGPRVIICGAPMVGKAKVAADEWVREVRARGVVVFPQGDVGGVQVEVRDGEIRARGTLGGQEWRGTVGEIDPE